MFTRAAIVTGSAQGIGKAIAIRLAKDGFNIVVSDIQRKSSQLEEVVHEIETLGRRATAIVCDVTVEEEVRNLVESTVIEFGTLDAMVANAGLAHFAPLTSLQEEDWDLLQSVNVKGTFFCYKWAATHLIEQGRGGRIIGACSIMGKTGSAAAAAYSASKFAVRGLTQCAAAELRQHNITVNAYAPGSIKTSMFDDSVASFKSLGMIAKSKTIADTIGEPEDIAALVSYLASEESSFITGQSLNINGGIYFE